ncbi:MAG: thioredoxin family protein [Bacteroidota bacterium]|nr:thioredoxin family protein [Bacteroidota bacterium]
MQILGKKHDYSTFVKWMEILNEEEEKNFGSIQTESLAFFTLLNLKRIQRLNKNIKVEANLLSTIKNLKSNQKWVVITEAWCGDSAQVLPVIAKFAEASEGKITLEIILRDENPDWITKYHTNGSHSIPKLISFDKAGNELFVWGPRPIIAQSLFIDWKENESGRSWKDFENELHTWYAKDKTQSTQIELQQILEQYAKDDSSVSA